MRPVVAVLMLGMWWYPVAAQPVGKVNKSPAEPVDLSAQDRAALAAAGLKPADEDGLLNYIRQRTLTDDSLAKIQAIIRRFQSDDFDERLKAVEAAIQFGPSAISPLREAQQSDDYEVAYRATECLKKLEKQVSHSQIAAAVVRELTKLKPANTSEVLLPYLPLADSPEVADLIQTALTAVALKDGQPDPVILAALKDPSPLRRTAAVIALITGGPEQERIRIPTAFEQVKATIAAEKDPESRFRMLLPFLTICREKAGVNYLLEILPQLPRGRLWQAEDYLLQLAGKDAPKIILGKTEAALQKGRDEWAAWWKDNNTKLDLAKFDYTPRILGETILVMADFRSGNPGYISILGPDLKERKRYTGLMGPMDVQFYPNGNMLVAEQNTNRVTIRDPNGKILITRNIGGRPNQVYGNPQSVQILANGNILVVCRNVITEFKKESEEVVMTYVRNNYDIVAAKRMPDGKTLVMVQNGPQHGFYLDEKGKELAEPKLTFGMPYYQGHIDHFAPDRILYTEMNQIVEYDLKTNKKIWTRNAPQPRSVQRLPNGNTLYVEMANTADQSSRLVEVTPTNVEVWSFQVKSDFQPYKAYRR